VDINASAVQHFAEAKSYGFIIVFLFCTLIQVLSPHHADIKKDFRNWRVNLGLAGLNIILLTLLGAALVVSLSAWLVQNGWGLMQAFVVPLWLQILLSVLLLDFVAYAWHIANHRVPFLWRFHSVHHSDINFDTSTAVRFHVGELFISMMVRLLVVFVFGIPVIGLLVFELIYQFFNTFEHGNIRLPRWLEQVLQLVFVTPALHRKHHSVRPHELNANYATIFSFWDRLGNTRVPSHSAEEFPVGLPGQKHDLGFVAVLKLPLK